MNKKLGNLNKFFVGSDVFIEQIAELTNNATKLISKYPPYNIKKIEENRYLIEIALAGFLKSEIEVEIDGNNLIIKGNTESNQSDDYIFKGISNRSFTKTFTISENTEVKNAEFMNGLLKIYLESFIPEHKKSKKININGE